MKSHKFNNIEWFLEDEELITPLRAIVPTEGMNRGYFSFDHGDRKFFLKFFREKGASGFLRNKVSPRGSQRVSVREEAS